MARLACDCERTDGVTLVTCRLASDATRTVTVEPTHEGPVWPPRRQGVPAAGWTDGTWTGVVEAGTVRGLGYATPADPEDDPVRVAEVAPAEPDGGDISAREVIRSLGDPAPARDAVPAASPATGDSDRLADEDRAETPRPPAGTDTDDPGATAGFRRTRETDRRREEATESVTPGPVTGAARLDAIDERLQTAERLAAVTTPEEARSAVEAAGGLAAVRSLVDQLEADREYLRRVDERTDHLREQTTETAVPLAALERLA